MRKYILILIVFFSSCSGFLSEHLSTGLEQEAVFENEVAVEAQLNALYNSVYDYGAIAGRTLAYCTPFAHWKSTSRSGNTYQQYLNGSLMASLSNGASIIRNHFHHIYSCNTLICGMEKSSLSEEYRTEVIAEARFLRAFNYFYLVRLFGDLPVYTSPPQEEKDYNIPRNSYKDVYALIINDLLYAQDNMRDRADQEAINGITDRANKYTATAVLAQVYAQIGAILSYPDHQAFGTVRTGEVAPDFSILGFTTAEEAWSAALDAADEVISDSDFELESDFRNLFRWDMKNHPEDFVSKERILVAQYTPNGTGANILSQNTLPLYLVGTENYSTYSSSYSNLNPTRFVFQKWAQTYGGDKGAKADNIDIYVNCNDPRFDATYYHTSWEQYVNDSGTQNNDGSYYRNIGYPTSGYIKSSGVNSDPHYKKYFTPTFNQSAGHAGVYVLRLPEMYFIAAEACAFAGKTGLLGDAYDYIEVLHRRARRSVDAGQSESDCPAWTKGQFGYGEDLITAIFWERIFEMGGEGHEWFDSHRYGAEWLVRNVYYPMHDFLQLPEQTNYNKLHWYERGNRYPLTIRSARASLFCEYPEYELNYNSALSKEDQNYFNHSQGDFFEQKENMDNNVETPDLDDDYVFEW